MRRQWRVKFDPKHDDPAACRDYLTCKKHGGYINDETLRHMGYVPISRECVWCGKPTDHEPRLHDQVTCEACWYWETRNL